MLKRISQNDDATIVFHVCLRARNNTLNLPVVARQPHPDTNSAAHTAARLVVAALRA